MADRGEHVVEALLFEEKPCPCVQDHRPKALSVEMHHVWPQYDQIAKHGKVIDKTTTSLCQIAHENVHGAIRRWLKGENGFRLPNRHQQKVAEAGLSKIREGR